MASVLYGKRALPLAWRVKKGKKGHFSAADQRVLLQQVQEILPKEATAIFLGDGEFDSVELQRVLDENGFDYVCRTALSTLVADRSGEIFPIGQLRSFSGERYAVLQDACVTVQDYGPLQVVVWHEEGYENGVPLVTNLGLAEDSTLRRRRSTSTSVAFRSRRCSLTQRAEASTCTKATSRLPSAWLGS